MSDKQLISTGCLLVIISLLLTPVLHIWSGFVLQKLWLWFVVPLFDVPPLSIVQAIGVSIVVGFLTQRPAPYQERELKEAVKSITYLLVCGILDPLVALSIGWLIMTLFM